MARELATYAEALGRRRATAPSAPPHPRHRPTVRWLQPSRPRRSDAVAALHGVSLDAGLAALADHGLVPAAWRTTPPRFVALGAQTELTRPTQLPTRPLLLALGSDPEGIAAATTQVAAFEDALNRWRSSPSRGDIVWCDATLPPGWVARRCMSQDKPLEAALAWIEAMCNLAPMHSSRVAPLDTATTAAALGLPMADAERLRARCLDARSAATQALFPARDGLDLDFDTVARVCTAEAAWQVLVAHGLRYAHAPIARAARAQGLPRRQGAWLDGAALAEVTMPFASLITLWQLGYPIRERVGRDPVVGVPPLGSSATEAADQR